MKRYFNSLRKSVWVVSAVLTLVSCNDWDDHYSFKADSETANITLAEALLSIPDAGNFISVLKNTYMFNDNKITSNTYWDLLEDDQFITVWLPLDEAVSSEDWDKYKKPLLDKTFSEHKRVGQEFIQNHIARFRYNVGPNTDQNVVMLSNKAYQSLPGSIGDVAYKDGNSKNIRLKNGILHILNGSIKYRPTIYEYLTRNSHDFKSEKGNIYDYRDILGKWFDKYTEEEIDELKSVSSGINPVTGVMEYVDSVIIRKSILLDKFGDISEEDSTYYVVLPTPEKWNLAYDSISKFFEYGSAEVDPDSLQEFYTKYAMLTDMFFNMNEKIQRSVKDSVVSTTYNRSYNMLNKVRFNVYDNPYAAGGLFADRIDSVICSNGKIFIKNGWPYEDARIFRRQIKLEAEDYDDYNTDLVHPRLNIPSVKGQKLDKVFVARVAEKKSALQWEASFKIRNNLKGKYRFKLVIFPDTLHKRRPNLFHPRLAYLEDSDWDTIYDESISLPFPPFLASETFENDPTKIDTMDFGIVEFPTCNYEKDSKNQPRVRVDILSQIDNTESDIYSAEMWLDCIILDPVFE